MIAAGNLLDGYVSELALDALHAGVSARQHDVLVEIAQLLYEIRLRTIEGKNVEA